MLTVSVVSITRVTFYHNIIFLFLTKEHPSTKQRTPHLRFTLHSVASPLNTVLEGVKENLFQK